VDFSATGSAVPSLPVSFARAGTLSNKRSIDHVETKKEKAQESPERLEEVI
jgi:hypothetical protein